MTLPWNRGDEEGSSPAWVELVPLSGHFTSGRSTTDRSESNDPVLVAPHRDPGEEAVNHDMPPEFERARASGDGREESEDVPAEAVDDGPAGHPDPESPGDATRPDAADSDESRPHAVASPEAGDGTPVTADPLGTSPVAAPDGEHGPDDEASPGSDDASSDGDVAPGDSRDSKDVVTADK